MAQLSELEVMQLQHRNLQQQVLQEVRQLHEVTASIEVLKQERSQLQAAAMELTELQARNQQLVQRLCGLEGARTEHARLQRQLEGLQLGLATYSAPLPKLAAAVAAARSHPAAAQAEAAEAWLGALKIGDSEDGDEEEQQQEQQQEQQEQQQQQQQEQLGLLQRLQELAAVLPGMDDGEREAALQDLQACCQQLQQQVLQSTPAVAG
jgi:hypothetical protein